MPAPPLPHDDAPPDTLDSVRSGGPWSPRRAAELLFKAGMDRQLADACEESHVEDCDIAIGDGHRGGDTEYAKKALVQPWFETADEIIQSNWSYVEDQRQGSMEALFDNATGWGGPLEPLAAALCSRMEELDDGFDADEFLLAVRGQCLEMARDAGLDALFDLQARLLGSCQARVSHTFSMRRLPDGEQAPMLPDFCSAHSARDWAEALSFLNLHPADFANAARAKALSQLADPGYFDGIGAQARPERAQIKRDTRSALERQGLARRAGRDPASWSGGMALLAKAWSSAGWSLPRDGSPPAISPADLVDVLCAEDGDIEALMTFGADGSSLQSHSELIDRFGEDSPLCGEPLARRSISIVHADLTLANRDVPFCGPVAVLVDDIAFDSDGASSSGLEPCMGPARKRGAEASELSWRLRDAPGRADASAVSDLRVRALSSAFAIDAPEAFDWALASAASRGPISSSAELAARSGFEEGARAAAARAARLGKKPRDRAPKTTRIDDFEVRHGGLVRAPWRALVKPSLAFKRDSLGNTLAHKACACSDPALLGLALDANPALAAEPNLDGQTPMDLIHHAQSLDSFLPLALAMLSRRPDLADAQAASGRTLLHLAAARHLPPVDTAKLIDAGCSMSGLDQLGRAPWFYWAHKGASDLRTLLAPALDRGWDINSADRFGRTLSHMVTRLESAQALLSLGADFGLRDSEGSSGGCSIPALDFATLEAQLLDACALPKVPRQRAKSL